MLSVLIPTYNYNITELIKQLLSQLNQVRFKYEIIVLDDASTDNNIIVANNAFCKNPPCIYHSNPENLGRTATRQTLANMAKFNYLLFLDADVLPKNDNFIDQFNISEQTADVVFGGITYSQKPPDCTKILRWKYGKAREAKTIKEREQMPYLSIISQCILIKKQLFQQANNFYKNVYGVDVLFAQNLEKLKATVIHIDNPIIHLGLEDNKAFISKTIKGLHSLYKFETSGKIPDNYRPIQKAYKWLHRYELNSFYISLIKLIEGAVLKNLNSNNPSLLLFDFYRLYIYAKLHQ